MIKQEGDVMDSGFLEHMNMLLADGEVPYLGFILETLTFASIKHQQKNLLIR
jgi:hypothetical protein